MKPKLSVVLPAFLGYDTIQVALEAWDAQTCRDRLEILVLCPGGAGPTAQSTLPPNHVIVPVGRAALHEARAIGIRKASGDYIMLAEDHCLPDPDWAQAILDRLEEGWDAVGPALRPGDRTTPWAEGSFLIGYGEWMLPVSGGPAAILCGWNGTIRTQALHDLGSELAGELLMGAFLIRRLSQQGLRFYLEDRARMSHYDPPHWAREIYLVYVVGTGFGAVRARRWPLPVRILYALAAPAIAFLHGKRAFVHYRRAGSQAGIRPATLGAAIVLAVAWGAGEAAGAMLGVSRVAPNLWVTEIKPVTREGLNQKCAT